ncbi:MAG: (deoxy)nucleoside triphosphate pyrophosphohydrolase [Candidatus Aminicenantes bacterium]|nr:(deoxy)nucleoside triphosphate pyrophosphohydrolase [Candidatus Aminicenantes bacterium]
MRVTAGVIVLKGKILIARRRLEDRFGGLWEFPGGKIDPGEKPQACLRRELREELGIETRVGGLLCSSRVDGPHHSIELLAYAVEVVSGKPKAHEHDELRWVEPGALGDYEFPQLDRPVVRLLQTPPAGPLRHSRRSRP